MVRSQAGVKVTRVAVRKVINRCPNGTIGVVFGRRKGCADLVHDTGGRWDPLAVKKVKVLVNDLLKGLGGVNRRFKRLRQVIDLLHFDLNVLAK